MDLNDLPKVRAGKKVFHLYTMKNGVGITCHGRPKKTDIIQLHKEFGINYVLTILYPKVLILWNFKNNKFDKFDKL